MDARMPSWNARYVCNVRRKLYAHAHVHAHAEADGEEHAAVVNSDSDKVSLPIVAVAENFARNYMGKQLKNTHNESKLVLEAQTL